MTSRGDSFNPPLPNIGIDLRVSLISAFHEAYAGISIRENIRSNYELFPRIITISNRHCFQNMQREKGMRKMSGEAHFRANMPFLLLSPVKRKMSRSFSVLFHFMYNRHLRKIGHTIVRITRQLSLMKSGTKASLCLQWAQG